MESLPLLIWLTLALLPYSSLASGYHEVAHPIETTPRYYAAGAYNATLCAGSISCAGPIDASLNRSIRFCESVQGDVVVSGPLRFQPRCLRRIEAGGSLVVEDNRYVTSLYGFGALRRIEGDLRLVNNPFLVSLKGIDALEQVDGYLYIVANGRAAALSYIDALVYSIEDSGRPLEDLARRDPRAELVDDNFYLPRRVRTSPDPEAQGFIPSDPLESTLLDGDSLVALVSLHGLGALRRVLGDVYIVDNPELRTLHGAEVLSEVGNVYVERNHWLSSFEGWVNVSLIQGNLTVVSNPSLRSLTGLEKLQTIAGSAIIKDNDGLEEIGVLPLLRHINGDLEIRRNYNLQALSFSGNLALISINGSFYLDDHPQLSSCAGLYNLSKIGEHVVILHNPQLESLHDSFNSLRTVGGNLFIQGNMATMNGLEALQEIRGSLYLHSLPFLFSLQGLSRLRTIGQDMFIYLNEQLSSISDLSQLEFVGGDVQIHDNLNLTNISGVLEALHHVQGYFLIDYAHGRIDCPKGSGTLLGQTSMMDPERSFNESFGNWCSVACKQWHELAGNVQAGVSVPMWQCREDDFWSSAWGPFCTP